MVVVSLLVVKFKKFIKKKKKSSFFNVKCLKSSKVFNVKCIKLISAIKVLDNLPCNLDSLNLHDFFFFF